MRFTAAAVLGFAATALAGSNVTVVTEVVESFVTYCPASTTLTYGSSTYTVTAPTTLTITDCPCTITRPVTTSTVQACHTCAANSTVVVAPTGGVTVPPTGPKPTTPPTAGAAQAGLSAAAGLLAAAFFL